MSEAQEKPIYLSFVDTWGFFRVKVKPGMTLKDVLQEVFDRFEVGFVPGDYTIGMDEEIFDLVLEDEILFVTKGNGTNPAKRLP